MHKTGSTARVNGHATNGVKRLRRLAPTLPGCLLTAAVTLVILHIHLIKQLHQGPSRRPNPY
jgi:hypothetical protein